MYTFETMLINIVEVQYKVQYKVQFTVLIKPCIIIRLGDRTSEDGARTPILKTIHIDPCQESTKGVKQFHSSCHNIQRKGLPAPSPY